MKKKVVIGIVVLVVAAGAILGWSLLKNNKTSVAKYRLDKVTKGDIEALVATSGTLNPVTNVEVGSQVSGKIDKIYVDFNSQVKAGQILAELDRLPFETRVSQNNANYLSAQASLERSKVTLENLKKKYERSLSLATANLISFEEKEAAEANYLGAKTDVQSAEASLAQAKSQLESSKVDLSYAIIRSPIDGIVISRNINVGQTVAGELLGAQALRDRQRPEQDAGRMRRGRGRHRQGQRRPEGPVHGRRLPRRDVHRHRQPGPVFARPSPRTSSPTRRSSTSTIPS